jgi:prepilin-type N-terminal cleavage/methylation domain-containing protein
MSKARVQRGFSLLETLIALAILGGVLIVFLQWVWQGWAIEKRIAVHQLALRELEAQNEALRASGAVPTLEEVELTPLTDLDRVEDPRVVVAWAAREPIGLHTVVFTVSYRIGGQPFSRSLTTLSWQP